MRLKIKRKDMKGQEDFELIMETTERLKTQFAQLKAKIDELEAENARLRGMETADAFVGRLVKTTKKMYRINRKQADSVRQVLLMLNREEEQELADWMDSATTRRASVKKLVQHNVNSQVFNGEVTESEFNGNGRNGKKPWKEEEITSRSAAQ